MSAETKQGGAGAYLSLAAAVVFWGLSFVATKVALESIPVFTLVFARFGTSACLFAVLLARRGFPRFSKKNRGKMLLLALSEPVLYFIFETYGLRLSPAAKVSLIIATVPVAVTLLSALILKERTGGAGILGIVVSLAGISVLVAGDPAFKLSMGGPLLGDLLVFGAVISAALYMVFARDVGREHSSLEITGVQTIYGGLFFAPAFLFELPSLNWEAITGRSVGAVLYLTVFATIIAFLCWNHALTRLPAARASVAINGVPVVTAFGAWLLIGETLTLVQMSGGLLVLAGVFLTNLPAIYQSGKRRKTASRKIR
jgi:drug/metabolite transporter (DMT)-like permease